MTSSFLERVFSAQLLFVAGRFVTRQFWRILKLTCPLLGPLIVVLGLVGAYKAAHFVPARISAPLHCGG